jgi:hypothetical protein
MELDGYYGGTDVPESKRMEDAPQRSRPAVPRCYASPGRAVAHLRKDASLDSATRRLNSPPLTAAGLRGSIVVIGFWTYTCINWLRTLSYPRA